MANRRSTGPAPIHSTSSLGRDLNVSVLDDSAHRAATRPTRGVTVQVAKLGPERHQLTDRFVKLRQVARHGPEHVRTWPRARGRKVEDLPNLIKRQTQPLGPGDEGHSTRSRISVLGLLRDDVHVDGGRFAEEAVHG